MKPLHLSILVALSCFVAPTAGAKILALLPMGSKSHKNIFIPLMEELSRRNHELTQITLFRSAENIKGMTTIYLERANQKYLEMAPQASNMSKVSFGMLSRIRNLLREGCEVIFSDPIIVNFRANPGHFDVILVSSIMNECYMPIAHELGAPIIIVSPSVLFNNVAWDLNVPNPWSYVPFILTPFNSVMSFSQRAVNVFANLAWLATLKYIMGPVADGVASQYIKNAVSGVDSSNVSLVLVNSHFSMNDPRPSMPYVVEVGGMHCREAQKLPEEFEKFVNSSGDDGFIVFSMGSVLEGQYLPESFAEAFKTAFSKLKQKVIWKFEKPMDGLSPNVMISKWIPQQDLIGHPKCRLAITHGGLLSLQEVLYHGVPLLGIPMGADRDSNINQAVDKGFAELVDFDTLNADNVLEKITTILSNKKYKEKVREVSALMKDRPQPPVETAAYWVEYVIRHKGARHLRSAADHLNFFQYFLLDVIAFVSLIGISALALTIFLVKKAVNCCRGKCSLARCTTTKTKKEKKKKPKTN